VKYENIIKKVKRETGAKTDDEALGALIAVLETLGERSDKTERENLQAQLPKELKKYVEMKNRHESAWQEYENYWLEEFYRRSSARMGLTSLKGKLRTKSVIKVLREIGLGGVLDEMLRKLPGEFSKLLR